MTGRPQQFAMAQMRERITIQEASIAANSIGEPVRTWETKYLSQPAKWMPTAGQEVIRGRSVEAGVAVVFTMRIQDGITPEMRAVHHSGTYGITYVKPVDGMPRYLELHCKAVA